MCILDPIGFTLSTSVAGSFGRLYLHTSIQTLIYHLVHHYSTLQPNYVSIEALHSKINLEGNEQILALIIVI